MEFNIRQLEPTDYDTLLVKWWDAWGFKPPPRDFLPDGGTGGLLISNNETPVCAGFIYMTNSKISWINWIISNKEYKNKNRNSAIKTLLKQLIDTAINSDAYYVFASNNNKFLINKFTDLGFVKGSKSTELILKI
tara:strand:+ start:2293 stop:2697 length:405 start_codon:yes stop_codon:yes gene_type:complete